MTFVVIVIVFGLVQYWGSAQTFQRDSGYREWLQTTRAWFPNANVQLLAQVVLPVIVLLAVLGIIGGWSGFLLFLVSIPLLLFSLGRGDFQEWLSAYCEAAHRNDNEIATEYANRLGVNTDEVSDWQGLHRLVLRRAGYLGFERWFSAIFWFVLIGPVGAVFYRLTALAQEAPDQSDEVVALATRLRWLLEWPAVRLLGLSFALTGNFVGCIQHWRECLLCLKRPTEEVMEHYIHGALNVNASDITQESVTEQELEALVPLLTRSLILWLCVLAVFAIV